MCLWFFFKYYKINFALRYVCILSLQDFFLRCRHINALFDDEISTGGGLNNDYNLDVNQLSSKFCTLLENDRLLCEPLQVN